MRANDALFYCCIPVALISAARCLLSCLRFLSKIVNCTSILEAGIHGIIFIAQPYNSVNNDRCNVVKTGIYTCIGYRNVAIINHTGSMNVNKMA